MLLPIKDKRHLKLFSDLQKSKVGRCWAPFEDCREPPINAHSIQNSRILDKLQQEGVLTHIGSEVSGKGHKTILRTIGRNKASTFKGLCSKHDQEIFSLIDNYPLDVRNKEMCDLLMWRAITSEMSEKMNMLWYFQGQYQEKIDNGEIDKDEPHAFGTEAILWAMVLYDFHSYREEFWSPRIGFSETRDLENNVLHKHFRISDTGPVLAAASFFSLEDNFGRKGNIGINVWPDKRDTIALLSYSRKDLPIAPRHLRQFLRNGKLNEQGLSALLLSHVQNFFLKPSIVERWSNKKRDTVIQAFSETVTSDKLVSPSESINLFSN